MSAESAEIETLSAIRTTKQTDLKSEVSSKAESNLLEKI